MTELKQNFHNNSSNISCSHIKFKATRILNANLFNKKIRALSPTGKLTKFKNDMNFDNYLFWKIEHIRSFASL